MAMDKKGKKNIISKTLSRCRSIGTVPKGCFSVYVGPQRERFVIRTEWLNHPLFRTLLDESEMEYGFHRAGPLELPCSVMSFQWVMMEMSQEEDAGLPSCGGCARSPLSSFSRSISGHRLVNPA